MGRHGGGSSSGGGSRGGGSRGGGSRGGGSGAKTSKTPFVGCYNRSYYDRRGRFHSYYTSDSTFGTSPGWSVIKILGLLLITFHMVFMVYGLVGASVHIGGKVDGDLSRIFIEDYKNLLTAKEEQEVLELFLEIYDVSGMPITLYTDDFSWKEHYKSLEIYSEELYYQIGFDEDAMIILFTADTVDGFEEWEYDMYCGDDTFKCFSDKAFDKLLENFQKGMAKRNLAMALDHAWKSVMDDLATTTVDWKTLLIMMLFFFIAYGALFSSILGDTFKKNAAYRYFRENPSKLSGECMTTIYSICPNCGASNNNGDETCMYCGSFLKAREGNTQYINPDSKGM